MVLGGSSTHEGWCPVALPVSGSASNFYTGVEGTMIPWNLKSQSSENSDYVRKGRASLQGKKQLRWVVERVGGGRGEATGKAGDTSSHPFRRIENHDLSFVSETRRHAFSGNSPFVGEKRVTYVSAGSRYANRSMENAHARCLWDSSRISSKRRNLYIFCILLHYQAWAHFI